MSDPSLAQRGFRSAACRGPAQRASGGLGLIALAALLGACSSGDSMSPAAPASSDGRSNDSGVGSGGDAVALAPDARAPSGPDGASLADAQPAPTADAASVPDGAPDDAPIADDGSGNVDAPIGAGDAGPGSFPCGTAPTGVAPPLSVPTGGKTYYVSPMGSDSNNGLSTSSPFQTLQQGANTAKAGDTVLAMSGTYTNSGTNDVVDIKTSGTASAWIVFAAAPGAHPLVSFNGWAGFNITGSYVAIDGFEIQGDRTAITQAQAVSYQTSGQYPASANGGGIVAGSFAANTGPNHLIIRNNRIHDCTEVGIEVMACDYVTIEYNETYLNAYWSPYGGSGISFAVALGIDGSTATKNFIRNNVSHDNEEFVLETACNDKICDGNGIIVDTNNRNSYSGRTLVTNNLVYGNGGSGIHSYDSDHIDMVNNTAYMNNHSPAINEGQIFGQSATDINIINNVMWAFSGKPVNGQGTYDYNLYFNGTPMNQGAHDVVANPMFENAACDDFRLLAGSPGIGTGTSMLAPTTDLLNATRPAGAITRGAYQLP